MATTRQPRPIDTVLTRDATWTYDRATDKVTRVEAAPPTPASRDLTDILKSLGARPIQD